MHNDVEKILFDEEQIKKRIAELGTEITKDYKGKKLLCLGTLIGSFIFASELVKHIDLPIRVDFLAASSYGSSSVSSGDVKITRDIDFDISSYDVLIIEDIIDTGFTLSRITKILKDRSPKSVKICTLLDKPARRRVSLTAEYTGFTVPDEFIVGYGLDFNNKYRNLPYIGVLKPEIYN